MAHRKKLYEVSCQHKREVVMACNMVEAIETFEASFGRNLKKALPKADREIQEAKLLHADWIE